MSHLGSAVDKTVKLIWQASLESGAKLETWRRQVKGFLSDQGTERLVTKAPFFDSTDQESIRATVQKLQSGEATVNDASVRQTYFLPSCLEHIGHKHVIFNALESAVESQHEWSEFKVGLAALLKLLGKRCNRERLIGSCMTGAGVTEAEKMLLNRCNNKSIVDWRWEYLEDALYVVAEAFPVVAKYFDKAAFSNLMDKSDLIATERAITDPAWIVQCSLFHLVCYAAGKEARWPGAHWRSCILRSTLQDFRAVRPCG